ncbi:hypothetical protein SMD22_00430 (plasmid) [Brevibacillus halotolerans]|nr:hypothetical protein SMD22_00430 [Brevibacillus halotolerans]
MDIRTLFYLDCLKLQVGLSQKVIPRSNFKGFGKIIQNLKNFIKTTQSDQYDTVLNEFILTVEDYLSEPGIKPYVYIKGVRTHWTLLPFETPEEKWKHYTQIRDKSIKLQGSHKRKT